jgi:hypothetical protein
MKRLALILALTPAAGQACEIGVPEVNQRMTLRSDCSFENAGPLDAWDGDMAQDVGGGVVVQEQDNHACGTFESLLVTDCATGEAMVIRGLPDSNGFTSSLDALFRPTGPVAIRQGMTLRELVSAAERHGAGVSGWQESIRAVETIPGDLPDAQCGCRVFYPGSTGAGG